MTARFALTLLLQALSLGSCLSFAPILTNLKSIPTKSTSLDATSFKSQVLDFNGHKYYTEITQPKKKSSFFSKPKPEVILIHGFGCSTVYWRETTKYLTNAGYTVHALDLLGQGKSAKPGREDGVEYSISLWAELVDCYASSQIRNNNGIVLIGNSLGSVVALAAATGDFQSSSSLAGITTTKAINPYIASKIKGVGMFNCGIGMNSRNIIRDPSFNLFQRTLLTFVFDTLDFLIFDNVPLLTYLLNEVVTKDLLKNALIGLYQCSPSPESRVDDELVDAFYLPAKDVGSVQALNQIYTNNPGKTPMEFHEDNHQQLSTLPIHFVWGDADNVTPITGSVGQFYTALANDGVNSNVSFDTIHSGHIPFDEIPECNEFMVRWLDDVVSS